MPLTRFTYNEVHHRSMSNYFWLLILFSGLLFFPIFSVFLGGYTQLIFRICVSFVIVWGAYVVTQNRKELLISTVLALLAMIGFWMGTDDLHPSRGLTIFRTLTGAIYFSYLGTGYVLRGWERGMSPLSPSTVLIYDLNFIQKISLFLSDLSYILLYIHDAIYP